MSGRDPGTSPDRSRHQASRFDPDEILGGAGDPEILGIPISVGIGPLFLAVLVGCWAGVVGPIAFSPELRAQVGPVWWVAAFAYPLAYAGLRGSIENPRQGGDRVAAVGLVVAGILMTLSAPADTSVSFVLALTNAVVGFVVSTRVVLALAVVHWVVLFRVVQLGLLESNPAWLLGAFTVASGIVAEISVREHLSRTRVGLAVAELQRAHAALADAREELAQHSREAERLRIARDLHDSIGHQLTALSLNLEAASHVVAGSGEQAVVTARELAREALFDLRRVVTELRETTGDLGAEIQRLAERAVGVEVAVAVDAAAAGAPERIRETVYRVVQECLTNVTRHADARHAWVQVQVEGPMLRLLVDDDGQTPPSSLAGHGLTGMAERCAEVGGTVTWGSRPGGGWRVEATLPFALSG